MRKRLNTSKQGRPSSLFWDRDKKSLWPAARLPPGLAAECYVLRRPGGNRDVPRKNAHGGAGAGASAVCVAARCCRARETSRQGAVQRRLPDISRRDLRPDLCWCSLEGKKKAPRKFRRPFAEVCKTSFQGEGRCIQPVRTASDLPLSGVADAGCRCPHSPIPGGRGLRRQWRWQQRPSKQAVLEQAG